MADRGDEDVRRDLAAEREQLEEALADLRRSVAERRKVVGVAGGAVAAGVAARLALTIARRLTRRGDSR